MNKGTLYLENWAESGERKRKETHQCVKNGDYFFKLLQDPCLKTGFLSSFGLEKLCERLC